MYNKTFYEAMKDERNAAKTFTTNGAVAYESTGKEILNFNFAITRMREASDAEIKAMYAKTYYEDPLLAVKYLFYVGDVREGLGERKAFRACLDWLANTNPEVALQVLSFIPEYTRWDNLVRLINHERLHSNVRQIIQKQINADILAMKEEQPISLLAKWLPSENASSADTKALAREVRKAISMSSKNYRKVLSSLRKYLDVVEVKMSGKQWTEIDYAKVPSMANLKYKDAFMKNDLERRCQYLNSLAKGETKINAAVAGPSDIVSKYTPYQKDDTLEEMWKALPDIQLDNMLVVRDGSGSMTWGGSGASCPMNVATAMAIYSAQHNAGAWKNCFVTFSRNPEIVDIGNCKSLQETIKWVQYFDECANTDIWKTMMLILNTAVNEKISQAEMPKTILIISDMQFDGRMFNMNKTLFENIAEEYKAHGYLLPRICFWNVAASGRSAVPMQQNELGLVLMSGYSVSLLNMAMSGELDPYKALVSQVNSDRYQPIEDAVKDVL